MKGPDPRQPAPLDALLIGVLVVLAIGLAWWSMPNSAVPANDSATYVGMARNLADGKGFTAPFSHELSGLGPDDAVARVGAEPVTAWPPLYSGALATGMRLSLDLGSAARLVNVLAFGAVLALLARLARRLGASAGGAALAALLFAAGISTVTIFAIAGSEPLYLALQLGALAAAISLTTRLSAPRLAAFVVLAAAASLARYVGVATIPVGVLAIWASRDAKPVPARAVVGVAAGTIAALPVAVWMVHVARAPGFHGGLVGANRLGDLTMTTRSVGEWFVPQTWIDGWRIPVLVVLGIALAAVAAVGFLRGEARAGGDDATRDPALEQPRAGGARAAAVLVVVHAVLYELFVLASATFADHAIPLGFRLTLPLAPSLLALAVAGGERAVRHLPTRPLRLAALGTAAVVLVALIGAQQRDSYERVLSKSPAGLWTTLPATPATDAVQALPADAIVFTNQPSALYSLTQRPVLALPLERSPMTGAANPNASRDLDQLVHVLGRGNAYVVIDPRTAFFTDGVIVSEQELRDRLPLEVVAEDADLRVLRVVGTTAPTTPTDPAPR